MSIQALLEQIPFVAKVGVQCDDYAPGRVVVSLGGDAGNTTHIGALHPGAVFTLAEVAATAAAATHPYLARYKLLCRKLEVRFRRPTNKRVTAKAEVTNKMAAGVLAGIDRDGKADLVVAVQIEDSRGEVVAVVEGTYNYRLKRTEKGDAWREPMRSSGFDEVPLDAVGAAEDEPTMEATQIDPAFEDDGDEGTPIEAVFADELLDDDK